MHPAEDQTMGFRPTTQASGLRQNGRMELLARARTIWIGVSGQPLDNRSPTSWWCFPRTAMRGDLLAMYERLIGIVRLESIESHPHEGELRCAQVGLLTAETKFICSLVRPITARELKNNKVLRNLPAVRRNFQGTCFPVPDEYRPHLRELIVERLE
jgi:hypothetical protein